jgi:ABC-type polysaccharide/polyol phosphate export permease/Flp pilus assembly protein TadD
LTDFQSLAQQAVATAAEHPNDVAVLMHAASMLLHAGEIQQSVAFARAAVALAPGEFSALRTLSGIVAAAGDRGEAIDLARQAAGIAPEDGEVRLHLGALLAADHRWREVVDHLSVHVTSSGATAVGWRLLASALHQAGDTRRATDAARAAVAAEPDSVEYRLNLASLLSNRALHAQAMQEVRTAQALAPDDASVWRVLSGLHAALGERDDALLAAGRAVELAPDDRDSRVHLTYVAALYATPEAAADPAVWSLRRHRSAVSRAVPSLAEDIAARGRVIHAIVLRDIRTRFGHTKLGYFWAIMEPITHLMTLGTIFYALNHGPPPVGENLFLFYITGLIPFLMFSHVSHDVMSAAEANNAMLQLPVVKRTDIMAAHAVRQFATELCVGAVIFSIAALLGQRGVPADPLTAMSAILLLWLFAVGVGAFNLVVVEMFPSYETVYAAFLRLLYVTSGIYYSPIAMPDWIREALAWNPILQGIEFFRSGFFPQYEPHWLDPAYLLTWVVASIGLGFGLERALRVRMVVYT